MSAVTIARLKITLDDVKPAVQRRVEVPFDIRLDHLHLILQAAIGWAAPDIPTFAELGFPQVSFSAWNGLFAPKGTPKDIIGKLNAAVTEALADPAVRSRFFDLGLEIFPRDQQTPEALRALQKAEIAKWWPIIKAAGIKAE
jgi:tripartite-type tricarboxylate transporter receptor subunit TctC